MLKCLLLICFIVVTGCDDGVSKSYLQYRSIEDVEIPDTIQDNRIVVKRIKIIDDSLAYNDKRGVYIITDAKTGKEYVGISGIGISEISSHMVGKVRLEDER